MLKSIYLNTRSSSQIAHYSLSIFSYPARRVSSSQRTCTPAPMDSENEGRKRKRDDMNGNGKKKKKMVHLAAPAPAPEDRDIVVAQDLVDIIMTLSALQLSDPPPAATSTEEELIAAFSAMRLGDAQIVSVLDASLVDGGNLAIAPPPTEEVVLDAIVPGVNLAIVLLPTEVIHDAILHQPGVDFAIAPPPTEEVGSNSPQISEAGDQESPGGSDSSTRSDATSTARMVLPVATMNSTN